MQSTSDSFHVGQGWPFRFKFLYVMLKRPQPMNIGFLAAHIKNLVGRSGSNGPNHSGI
jgi:hypothetical protein